MADDASPSSPWLEPPAGSEDPDTSRDEPSGHPDTSEKPPLSLEGHPQPEELHEVETTPSAVSPSAPGSDNEGVAQDQDEQTNDEFNDSPHLDENDDQFNDDFDAFEVGAGEGEQDDFGDFDDAFEEPVSEPIVDRTTPDSQKTVPEQPPATAPPPLLDFSSIHSLSDLLTSASGHLDTLFPNATKTASVPSFDSPPNSSIFMTERSHSLWSQLVAPPPLQPPNWTKSRIRRLFLVSLGVPVDLDEILPASKQKKLVLPSMNLEGSGKSTTSDGAPRSGSRPKKDGQQRSSASTDSRRSSSRARGPRRRGQPPEPNLDLSAVHRLCATTDAALDGLTDEEMQAHVQKLQEMTLRASEVLEYWLKRRDGQLGEKEAFEGVIENLVKHARQVRK